MRNFSSCPIIGEYYTIQRILQNPIYCGLILVRAYREYPEELVKGIHKPLIDEIT
ncbi:recombinase family protein [Dyadobacter pollutisoli]|uniref:recombinase family protein n=1 Tax=Dyadobacter pollutisoli TaxID=2910158 RepID=UPI0035B669E3